MRTIVLKERWKDWQIPSIKRSSLTIDTVEALIITAVHSTEYLSPFILDSLPNLTSISCLYHTKSILWGSLFVCPPVKLRRLINTFPDPSQTALFLAMTPCLEELRISKVLLTADLASMLVEKCLQLKVLEVGCDDHTTIDSIKLILEHCAYIKELTLHKLRCDGNIVDEIVLAGYPKLNVLRFINAVTPKTESTLIGGKFANLLERHMWLDLLQLNEFYYHRAGGDLRLSTSIALGTLMRVLSSCSKVQSLALEVTLDSTSLKEKLSIIVEALGHVDSISVASAESGVDQDSLLFVPMSMPLLKRLTVKCSNLCNIRLMNLASTCTHLEFLHLEGLTAVEITDDSVKTVLDNCPRLKEIVIDCGPEMTFNCLESIIDNQLRLEKVTWKRAGDRQASIDKFRGLVRERQFLPIPVLEEEAI